MPASRPTRPAGAVVAASLLSLLLLAPAVRAQGSDWPRQFDNTSGTFIVYQPQPEQLNGSTVTARAAFSLRKAGEAAATFGVLWFQAHVQVDRDSNTVTESDLDVTTVRLPGASTVEAKRYEHLVEAEATGWDLSGSLDELQSGLAASAKERLSIADLDHTPPKIVFYTHRALLVLYDGAPQLEPIEDTALERVVNTACAVVFDPQASTYYLSGANLWYRAKDALGPWAVIDAPPENIAAVVPPDTSASDQLAGAPPVVITATEPTELIVTDGEPQLEPLVGDELFYVSNTESDVLRDVKTGSVFVLLSGRWFTAKGLDDPWVYIPSDELPAIFQQIPESSPKGSLLANVAGTDAADDAVADDQIPQTSEIARGDTDVTVEWDGTPEFEAIPGTALQYAVNTDAEVILGGGIYYLCDQGVWYVANNPNGPWRVSDLRPEGLDDVPPSCPVYNVRYVYIFSTSPEAIEFGYYPGYAGCFPCGGCVVYGTGYRYHSWRGRHHYYPRPTTWGFQARYNPWLHRWSFGFTYWSGFYRTGLRWSPLYGPGRARHTPPWFGPGGYRRPLLAQDHTMARIRPNRGRARVPDTTPANIYTRAANAHRTARPLPVKPREVGRGAGRSAHLPNNVFAGSDGRVYRRNDGGAWEVNKGRTWVPTPMPVAPVAPVVPMGRGGDAGGQHPRGGPQSPNIQPAPQPVAPGGGSGAPTGGTGRSDLGQRQHTQPAPMPVAPVTPTYPPQRPSRPPVSAPVVRPPAAPVTPTNSPGGLERDFRARERANNPPPPVVHSAPERAPARPAPAPAPARQAPEKPRGAPEKPKDQGHGGHGH